jgi:hypothetical protein
MSHTISDLLPNVTADIDDNDIVLDAVVLLRVINTEGDGKPRIVLAHTPDLDWIIQVGMLKVALTICTTGIEEDDRHDE